MRCLRLLLLFVFCLPLVCFGQDDVVVDTAVTIEQTNEPTFEPPPAEEEDTKATFNTMEEQPGPVELKKLPPQTVDQLKKDEDYWYADWEPTKQKIAEPKPRDNRSISMNLGWLKPVFWIVMIGGLIAGIIWFLAHNDVRLFAKSSKKIAVEEEQEVLSDDIFAIDYDKEIRRAEEAGNYRLAVRLWYLRTLREMADRGLIDYRFGKTNSDYVTALYGGQYYKPFFGLTRTFDYTWYGQFPLAAENYTAVAADFMAFKKGLGA